MRKIYALVLSEWLYIVRDRVALLMLVLMPLIFTSLLGLVFGGAGNVPLRIGVVPGNPELTQSLSEVLAKEKGLTFTTLSREEAELRIRRATLDAAVIVPAGAVPSQGMKIMTDATTQRGYDAYARMLGLQAAVSGRVTASGLAASLLPAGSDASAAAIRYGQTALPQVQVNRTWKLVADGVLQVSPGMLVMFVLMFAAFSGEGIVQERENGTLRRLLAAPVSGWQYLAGRLIGKISVGMIQFLCLATFGALVFKVNWGSAPVMMLLTGLIFTTACASFGLFLGMVCRTPDQLSAVATMACLAMAALGGAWWPIEATPQVLQAIGRILPTGHAMQAFHALILYGADGVREAQQAWLGMAAWGGAFLAIGVALFRRGWRRGPAIVTKAAG